MADRESKPTADSDLLAHLGIGAMEGGVGRTSDGWLVIIYANVAQPSLTHWMGKPITYLIGDGMPVAS